MNRITAPAAVKGSDIEPKGNPPAWVAFWLFAGSGICRMLY